jgi:hypothetical protein
MLFVLLGKNSLATHNSNSTNHSLLHIPSSLSTELKRQTSTPSSFYSVVSSATADEQSLVSPQDSMPKTNLFTDIVNELIQGVNGLDRLSCTPATFTASIQDFVQLSVDERIHAVNVLEQQISK